MPRGWRLYTSPLTCCGVSTSTIVAVTSATVVPTLLDAGQASAAKLAALQRSAAFGSPTSPCGRMTPTDLTSSLVGDSEKAVLIVTSGCAPACVVDGVTLKVVTDTDASAPAGKASASSTASAASGVRTSRGR